jgi:large subunit ribosomal protein L18
MSGRHNQVERHRIRRLRIRKKLVGTGERPRLSVFRSAKHIYAQVVDDERGVTLAAASSRETLPKGGADDAKGRIGACAAVGKLIASRAKEKGVSRVCFDRGGYLYHGRIKALADGARAGGLEF